MSLSTSCLSTKTFLSVYISWAKGTGKSWGGSETFKSYSWSLKSFRNLLSLKSLCFRTSRSFERWDTNYLKCLIWPSWSWFLFFSSLFFISKNVSFFFWLRLSWISYCRLVEVAYNRSLRSWLSYCKFSLIWIDSLAKFSSRFYKSTLISDSCFKFLLRSWIKLSWTSMFY